MTINEMISVIDAIAARRDAGFIDTLAWTVETEIGRDTFARERNRREHDSQKCEEAVA